MSGAAIAFAALAAALLFWVVGAYHRLKRLRAEAARRFAPLAAAVAARQALLGRQVDALLPVLASAGPRLDSLRAACGQADAALAHAHERPTQRERIASLRLAEEILADVRARLPVQGALGAELADLHAEIAATDATIVFARQQFNDAAAGYNAAAGQFPTLVVAAIFSMRPAGLL